MADPKVKVPKPLEGALAEFAKELAKSIEKRSAPLSSAGEESIRRASGFSPEFAVAVDQALGGGGAEEVRGHGEMLSGRPTEPHTLFGPDSPEWDSPYDWAAGAPGDVPSWYGPTGNYQTPMRQTTEALVDNADKNRESWRTQRGSAPDSWWKQENIPAIIPPLAAAGVGAAILAPGSAQASPTGPGGAIQQAKEQAGPFPWSGAAQRNPVAAAAIGTVVEGGLGQFWSVANKFKKQHIDPIVRDIQENNRMLFITGNPWEQQLGQPEKPGVLGELRDQKPVASFMIENAGRLALGETEVNTKGAPVPGHPGEFEGSTHPTTQEALLQMEAHGISSTATAAIQSFLREGSNLPFYLVPGLGKGAVAQGMTGGFLSSVADPEVQDLKTATYTGGALGHGMEKGLKAGGKLVDNVVTSESVKMLKETVGGLLPKRKIPVAVVPPDEVNKLAQQLVDLPPTVISSKRSDPNALAVVVDATDDGAAKVLEATVAGGRGLSTRAITSPSKGKAPVMLSPKAEQIIDLDPTGDVAQAYSALTRGHERDVRADIDITDWSAQDFKLSNGLVLVADGDMVKLMDAADPALQRDMLRSRGLVEVTMRDGSKKLAFSRDIPTHATKVDPTQITPPGADISPRTPNAKLVRKTLLIRPDEGDMLLNPLEKDIMVDLDNLGDIERIDLVESTSDLNNILLERERAHAALEDQLEMEKYVEQAVQADVAAGGDGSGGSLPPPPPHNGPVPPPTPPPPSGTTMGILEDVKHKWWQRAANYVDRKLLPPTARGPIDQVDLAITAHSLDAMQRMKKDIHTRLETAFPQLQKTAPAKKYEFLSNVSRYVDGDLSLDDLKRFHPELEQTQFQILEQEKADIARNDLELRALGMLDSELDVRRALKLGAEDDLPDYGVRMYMRNLLEPGGWQKIAKTDEQGMASLTNAIMDDVYSGKKFDHMSWQERNYLARRHLDFLLGDPQRMADARKNPEGAWKDIVSEAQGSLKARKDLRWWEKAAFGEIDGGFIRIAESRTRQKQLIAQGHMWKTLADNPNLATTADNIVKRAQLGHTVQIPLNRAKFGLAAGMFTSPETFEALVQIPLAQKNAMSTIARVINYLKWTKTVGNPGSWVTNFLANAQNAAMSNLTNPWAAPIQIGNGMRLFASDLKAYKSAPGFQATVPQQRFNEAMKRGIIGSDYASSEFQSAAREWGQQLELEAKVMGNVQWQQMLPSMLRKLKGGVGALNKYYGAIDTMWKYAVWTSGLEKAGINLTTGEIESAKAAKFLGKNFRTYMEGDALREAVMNEVSRRIHLSFPMLDRVAPAVLAGNKAAGLINPFFKVKMEQMRVYGQLPKRALKEPGMASNLLGYGAIAATFAIGLKAMREAQGVSQAEIDSDFASAPQGVQRYKPGLTALWFHDDKGRLQFIDTTQVFEPMSYLQGDPNTAFPARILQNMAMSPVDGSIIDPEIQELLAMSGAIDPAFRRPEVAAWQQSGAQLTTELMSRATPAIFRNTYTTLERGGVGFAPKGTRVGPVEPQGAGTTVFNAIMGPNRTVALGDRQARDAALQALKAERMKLKNEIKQLARKTEGQSTGSMTLPLNKDSAMKRALEAYEQKSKEIEQLQRKLGR